MKKVGSGLHRWQLLLTIGISLLFLIVAASQIHFADVWQALRQADFLWLIPAAFLYLGAFSCRTLRCKVLIQPEHQATFKDLLPATAIGRAANNLLPSRIGEGVRIYLLKKLNGVNYGTGTASLILERVSDLAAMLIFVFVSVFLVGLPLGLPPELLSVLVFLPLVSVIGIYLTILFPLRVWRICEWAIQHLTPGRFHKPLLSFTKQLLDGIVSVRSLSKITLVLALALATWGFELCVYRLTMNVFGITTRLPHIILMSAAANLGTAIPSAAGNLGTFDTPGFWVLNNVAGVNSGTAGSYILVLHSLLWVTETALGLAFMWLTGLSWQTIWLQQTSDLAPQKSSHTSSLP